MVPALANVAPELEEAPSFMVGKWLRDTVAPLPLLIGVAFALGTCGWTGLRSGALFLFGFDERADLLQARNALMSGARGVLWGTLLQFFALGAVALALMAVPDRPWNPSPLEDFRHAACLAPISAILLGRLFLAPLAESAADRAGVKRWRALRGEEWLVFVLFLLPLGWSCLLLVRYTS